ncbi:MAG: prepilin-type N-terminal cleavage/methylation domain-containing protein [Patescibacteria group bacterium]
MRKGFTLIEVLISLTIIGLLFGFGFANFRDYSRRQQLLSVARNLKGQIRLVQSKASAGEKPDDIKCNGTNTLSSYSFQIVSTTSYRTVANCMGGNVTIKTENLPDGISMSPTSGIISFKVLGQGTNITAGGSFVITLTQTGTGSTSLVTVTAGGEIK